jgi:heme exporter protein B
LLAVRSRGEVVQPAVFFVIVASLFPLGVGADSNLLARIAPGVVWVCGLLAALLSLPRLFNGDFIDGTLEQTLLSPYPLAALVAGKISAHWLTTGLPLSLIAPILGLQFGLAPNELGLLVVTLLLGTPMLSMIGAIAAALTLGTRGSSVLIALLVLPLYVPVLIFGAGAVEASLSGVDYSGHLALLGAGTLLGGVFSPFVVAAALRISLD